MYVAKMTTRYPDFHGSGYYNFLMATTEDKLNGLIEEYSHDFQHQKTVKVPVEDGEELISMYPTKHHLNKDLFA